MACDSIGITVGAGSDDARDDGSVSIVLVTRAIVEDTGTHNSGGVGTQSLVIHCSVSG